MRNSLVVYIISLLLLLVGALVINLTPLTATQFMCGDTPSIVFLVLTICALVSGFLVVLRSPKNVKGLYTKREKWTLLFIVGVVVPGAFYIFNMVTMPNKLQCPPKQ